MKIILGTIHVFYLQEFGGYAHLITTMIKNNLLKHDWEYKFMFFPSENNQLILLLPGNYFFMELIHNVIKILIFA